MEKAKKLQSYFPMIRSREEILKEISGREDLKTAFEKWNENQQTMFLDCCSGMKGIKMLYDGFFKEIMNPDTMPERMEELLSLILGQKVHILKVLPNEGGRITPESSLLIMDIVVELKDGSIANVECQRLGYAFPGQRAACYSADLLMRQYRRVRSEKGDDFLYSDIRKVYTIVFYEKSPKNFNSFSDCYIHKFYQKSDTGMEMELLQTFVFIPLDIYVKFHHNKGIRNKLEAWLTFLGNDCPEAIIDLIVRYPEFRPIYEHAYEMCLNMEDVMGIFSKELQKLDENTVQYMIDELQNENDELRNVISKQQSENAEKDAEIEFLKKKLAEHGITL